MRLTKLFEPVTMGKLDLRNRVVMGAMGTGMSETISDSIHAPGEKTINYYAERAKGGAGLIICEHISSQPIGLGGPVQGEIYSKEATQGWMKVVNAVHKYGAKIAIEIGHMGRCTDFTMQSAGVDRAFSPSAVPCHHVQFPVHEMTIDEIEAFKKDYVHCVKNAVTAGFDAVQLHFANGYFLASWLSGRTNKRVDRYGGTLEGRLRLPLELIAMIKSEVGTDYPLLARIATTEPYGGRGIEETKVIIRALEDAGVDMIDLNVGSPTEWDYEFPSYYQNPAFNISEVEEVRKCINIPVIGGGRITEPRMAEQMLQDNRVDLVQITRGMLADPYWVSKSQNGNVDTIRRCIGCTRCIDQLGMDDYSLKCSVNPFVGFEGNCVVKKAGETKKVLVVGGGPGGLQAAVIAAQRGHDVMLMEKEPSPGGLVKAASVPPLKWDTASLITSLLAEAEQAGVKILTNTEVTVETVQERKFDEIIIATGSTPLIPKIPGIDEPNVISALSLLEGVKWAGEKIAIIGGGMIGCEVADMLAEYGKDVTIYEMKDKIASDMWHSVKISTLRRIKQHGVHIHTGATVKTLNGKEIVFEIDGQQMKSCTYDTIIIAIGMKSDNVLSQRLTESGIKHTVIGDAASPSRLHEVLKDAVMATINI